MTTTGLTGGIGSGKSTVAALLEIHNIPVYNADAAAKRLMSASPSVRSKLTSLLGAEIYEADVLNRSLMASLIFNDADLLEKVNAIVHPAVADDFDKWKASLTSHCAVLESAILFESGFNAKVDLSATVYAPQALRLQRVMRRDKICESDVMQRMNRQWPDEKKKDHANYVIINDDRQALIPQVDKFILWMKAWRKIF